ncbi:MAG: hypothetical protein V1808_01710 [Candidatus Daviesbacteria bacterium]
METQSTKAEIYVPALAISPEQLKTKYDLLKTVREKDHRSGLMLVFRPKDLALEERQIILDNLDQFVGMSMEERPVIFAMHSNLPLSGPQRLNFLTNRRYSEEYIERSVDLVAQLPLELVPVSGRALSFHLNTLIIPEQWVSNEDFWKKAFEGVLKSVGDITSYAERNGVIVAVETTPIPEYGDVIRDTDHMMDDEKTYWADLGNPWPLLFWRDDISKLRQTGAKIAIDICHSFIALKAVQEACRLVSRGKNGVLKDYMLFEDDLREVNNVNFIQMVQQNTRRGDIWHVSDAKGIYKTPKLQGEQSYFQEGVDLFEGDMPVETLDRIIKYGLNSPIKFVLETNEVDYLNNPNTKKSLARIVERI